jgi:hypothetical protein
MLTPPSSESSESASVASVSFVFAVPSESSESSLLIVPARVLSGSLSLYSPIAGGAGGGEGGRLPLPLIETLPEGVELREIGT